MSREAGRGFDKVLLTEESGATHAMSPYEYEALPLDVRVRSILKKRLRFFFRGAEIPMREALKH